MAQSDIVDLASACDPLYGGCIELMRRNNYNAATLESVFRETQTIVTQLIEKTSPEICQSATDLSTKSLDDWIHVFPTLSSFMDSKLLEELDMWAESTFKVSLDIPSVIRATIRRHIIRIVDKLLSQLKEPVLNQPQFLAFTLRTIKKYSEKIEELYLTDYSYLLKDICVLFTRDTSLLTESRKISLEVTGQEYFVFSCLVPLIHLRNCAGNEARDAVLLILSLSTRDPDVTNYLTSSSDLCPILATGLSGIYSSLPKQFSSGILPYDLHTDIQSKTLHVGGQNWHRLSHDEWNSCPNVAYFMKTLDFCNLAVRKSHDAVKKELLHYILTGFLQPVLGSALYQASMDEIIAATAYLELFLRRITESSLLGLFIRFVLTSFYEKSALQASLISRINGNAMLGMVTLSLFRTIINLNCEDSMYELALKYLQSMRHIKSSIQSSKTECSNERSDLPRTCTSGYQSWLLSADRFFALAMPRGPSAPDSAVTTESDSHSSTNHGANHFKGYVEAARQQVTERMAVSATWSTGFPLYSAALIGQFDVKYAQHPSNDIANDADGILSSLPSSLPQAESSQHTFSLPYDPTLDAPFTIRASDFASSTRSLYQLHYMDDSDSEGTPPSPVPPHCISLPEARIDVLSSHGVELPCVNGDIDLDSVLSQSTEAVTDNSSLVAFLGVIRSFPSTGNSDDVLPFIAALSEYLPSGLSTQSFDQLLPTPPPDLFSVDLFSNLTTQTDEEVTTSQEDVSDTYNASSQNSQPEAKISKMSSNSVKKPLSPFGSIGLDMSPSPHLHCSPGALEFGSGLGPFLSALVNRLSAMTKNNFFINLLLTDVLVALASFPHFLLASLLLNNVSLNLNYPARSLYQVLSIIRLELDEMLLKVNDCEALVAKARDHLTAVDGTFTGHMVTTSANRSAS